MGGPGFWSYNASEEEWRSILRILIPGPADEFRQLKQKLDAEFAAYVARQLPGVPADVLQGVLWVGNVVGFVTGHPKVSRLSRALMQSISPRNCNQRADDLRILMSDIIEEDGAQDYCRIVYAFKRLHDHAWNILLFKYKVGVSDEENRLGRTYVTEGVWKYDGWLRKSYLLKMWIRLEN